MKTIGRADDNETDVDYLDCNLLQRANTPVDQLSHRNAPQYREKALRMHLV